MNQKISLVLCFDINYANQAAVATYSAIRNSSTPIQIYWIVPGNDFEATSKIYDHLKSLGFKIKLIRADESIFRGWKVAWQITRAAYLRLLIPDLINEEKIIYIDADVLVLSDLSEIFLNDMSDLPIGSVKDISSSINATKMPWIEGDIYINSGVMVMNLEILRRDRFLEKCQDIYNDFEERVVFFDQCIINKYAENRKYVLDKKWNFLIVTEDFLGVEFETLVLSNRLKVVHFAGAVKPWQKWCNPIIANYWWSYAKKLSIPGFRPTEISTINQALKFADILYKNSNFQESSEVKTTIINTLLNGKS